MTIEELRAFARSKLHQNSNEAQVINELLKLLFNDNVEIWPEAPVIVH